MAILVRCHCGKKFGCSKDYWLVECKNCNPEYLDNGCPGEEADTQILVCGICRSKVSMTQVSSFQEEATA
ncbi:MAG: hypothetical protein ACOYS2_01155 [Patescibacteria group bacterium]